MILTRSGTKNTVTLDQRLQLEWVSAIKHAVLELEASR